MPVTAAFLIGIVLFFAPGLGGLLMVFLVADLRNQTLLWMGFLVLSAASSFISCFLMMAGTQQSVAFRLTVSLIMVPVVLGLNLIAIIFGGCAGLIRSR